MSAGKEQKTKCETMRFSVWRNEAELWVWVREQRQNFMLNHGLLVIIVSFKLIRNILNSMVIIPIFVFKKTLKTFVIKSQVSWLLLSISMSKIKELSHLEAHKKVTGYSLKTNIFSIPSFSYFSYCKKTAASFVRYVHF